ncbi:NAD(P)-dependent oxidoreductase [Oceanibacterium hippocampi]|uniref:Glutamate synthase [NADPH] small chain n=1 Tax=Oceanibacterium hippocampi TaxID=745714 RepID=A0A1Y5RRD2_9PROT|nr:NAD(P)-dependent oxidoreductase [Oceanibacterium hippocampi]SLN23311.1 Glutamate synthase [NADPH] small chain [Oceanibacterium hippocampi]
MAERMLKFVNIEQRMPDKRGADERRTDFHEIYAEFQENAAREQSARCSQCGIPFCQVHCPVQNNIPDWLRLTAEGRLEEAYEVSQATNNFPEICGRICPQDRLCEGNCVIEKDFNSVTIGSVEKYITDTAWEQGWVKPVAPSVERAESIGIIGAGPGGMAAAEELRRRGYQVVVYDRYDRAGGLMMYGIPSFKLEKDIVERRTRLLADAAVEFRLNFEVGRDASLGELREKHDAILIATGVYRARDISVPGASLGNIFPAMRYLTASNRKGLGDSVPDFDDGTLNAKGKRVVVVGGGDTAMDCVRTAVRQGATSVKCLYRRDRDNMPGSMREVRNAEEEGVEFVWLSAPKAFLGNETVDGALVARMRLGMADASGRQTPEPIDGADYRIDADMVIKALGFDPEDLPQIFGEPGLEVSRWGTIKASFRNQMTSLEGVFAAGDIVRGASLVVWAIRDGRDAAASIHSFIQQRLAPPAEGEAPEALAS